MTPASADERDPKRVVAAGYDAVAERYLEWSANRPSDVRLRYLALAASLIRPGSDVLELGPGAGVPMTRALAESRRVTGVDISASQVRLARTNVPAATFLEADMTAVEFPAASFDGVVAFYSLTHLPREELPPLLGRIRRWLRPGGVLIASLGAEDAPDEFEDWLGVPMFFGHFGARRNRRLVADAGFVVEQARIEVEPEDRHDARFLWVVARVPVP